MKVLHVIPSVSKQSGGPAHAIFPMCRALVARGIEVTVATTNHDLSDLDAKSHGPQTYEGTITHFFPVQFGDGFKYSRPLKAWLEENVSPFDIVHIHAVFNHSSVAAAAACRKHRVPYVIRPLGTLDPWSMRQKRFRKSLFWMIEGKSILRSAKAIHCTTQTELDAVKRSLGLTNGVVVPLGIEMRSNSLGRNGSTRPSADPYLLVLSRLHPKKGLDVLIRAFLALKKDGMFSEWNLVIAGSGDTRYVNSLKQTARDHAAGETVRFSGWVSGDQKRELLSNASLLVLPSRQENFGLCVLEALAEGVPVLVSSEVNLATDVADAGVGWIAEVNAESLETTLANVLSDKEQRFKRGAAGREFARNFTWDRIAERLEAMYLSISERTS